MANTLTVKEVINISKTQLAVALGKYTKELEQLGMDHERAYYFLSSVMSIGIAADEVWHNTNHE